MCFILTFNKINSYFFVSIWIWKAWPKPISGSTPKKTRPLKGEQIVFRGDCDKANPDFNFHKFATLILSEDLRADDTT